MAQEQIFISYSRKDKDIVHPLVKEIEAATGISCWIDLNGIESGDEFEDKIIGAIEKVPVVIFMLSDNAMQSDYAKKEIRYAQNCEKKIVPVVIDGGKLRGWFLFSFGGVDFIDISNRDQKQKLFKNLKSWFDVPDNEQHIVADIQLEFAAEKGYAEAQALLGECYKNGWGVTQSYQEAVYWFKLAAEQGNTKAQESLGTCYLNGYGVPESNTEAVKWFKLAADKGNAKAQYSLGFCYENGYGVPESDTEAVKWYKLAAENGDDEALSLIGECYEKGYGVPQSYSEAVKWYKIAAEQGDFSCQYSLGECYQYGKGVPASRTEALKWYKLAADGGIVEAQRKVESLK